MGIYNIGIGKADITYGVAGIGMLGFAIPNQKTNGVVLTSLNSRAFVIQDQEQNGKLICIVIVDLWSCTEKIKKEVVSKLKGNGNNSFTADNLMICGTHTHSSPGGYSGYRMYNINTNAATASQYEKENIQTNFRKIVDGIVKSINQANILKPGRIFIHNGTNSQIKDCGLNRSLEAYLKNPIKEINSYDSETDNYMKLIKFVHVDIDSKTEQPVGVISWFPIHCTDMGQHNFCINGDNKGYAAELFEKKMNNGFVSAFANSNCGDISGNVFYDNGKKVLRPPVGGQPDIDNMQKHGRLQFEKAWELFNDDKNLVELEGRIDYRYMDSVDMSNRLNIFGDVNKRTYIPTTGLAAYAGSKEDGTTPFFQFNLLDEMKGLREDKLLILSELPLLLTIQALTSGEGPKNPLLLIIVNPLGALISKVSSCLTLNSMPVRMLSKQEKKGHFPKPIAVVAKNIVPTLLPMQLFKIGNLAIPGIPGELTTMAGRRLEKTILETFKSTEVKYIALGTYANAYSQYITTKEEYDNQNYEGASTLFGPYTLEAYQEIFQKLSISMQESTLQS